MTEPAKRIPTGISVVTPRLFCSDPAALIAFCTTTFGAVERGRRPGPDGKIAHALLDIGSSTLMIESEWPDVKNRAPARDGSSPVVLYVYVDDVDDAVGRAAAAGATILMPLTNQFWGDRTAWIMDPGGHVWTIATRIEETTEEERRRRLARSFGELTRAANERPARGLMEAQMTRRAASYTSAATASLDRSPSITTQPPAPACRR